MYLGASILKLPLRKYISSLIVMMLVTALMLLMVFTDNSDNV